MSDGLGAKLGHRLLQAGMVLFLLGVLTGLISGKLENPRVGLTSHLEGVMNGPFLIILGFLWPRLKLGNGALSAAFWMALISTYANWVTTLFAAAVGGGENMLPISSKGFPGTSAQEMIIFAGLMTTLLIIPMCAMVIYGLRGGPSKG